MMALPEMSWRYTLSAMLIVIGIIHLLPLSGVLGAQRLSALYGLDFSETNLAVLMRHRAVLFGILGAVFIYAAFKAEYQTLALILGLASVASFLYLAWSGKGYNMQIARVVRADLIALACLLVGAICKYMLARNL